MSKEATLNDIQHIYIDEKVVASSVAQRALKFFAADKISIVVDEPFAGDKGALSAAQFDRSKKNLFLTEFKGQFFKRCPGARPGLTCCNYFVLNLGLQCNMNCSYCYLQSFINTPVMKIYTNIEQAIAELAEMGRDLKGESLRLGTGEVIDSLSLDPLTLYSRELIRFFRDYPKWRLEFKTKSSQVNQFLDVEHAGNVIVSFSINPQNIIESEEHGTAALYDRLAAAEKCRDRGFLISFHFDPMIWHESWRDSYAQLVNEITARFKPSDVPICSVGALRFQPEQRHLMRERFGLNSHVMRAEVFAGGDGKLRYDQNVREEMFEFMLDKFRAHSSDWKIFLCMESPETWLGAVHSMPKSTPGLAEMFDGRVVKTFEKTFEKSFEKSFEKATQLLP